MKGLCGRPNEEFSVEGKPPVLPLQTTVVTPPSYNYFETTWSNSLKYSGEITILLKTSTVFSSKIFHLYISLQE